MIRFTLLNASIVIFGLLWGSSAAHASWFVSARTGPMQVKFENVEVDKNPLSVSVIAGYEFTSILRGLAAEFEVSQSIVPGEIDLEGTGTSEFDLDSKGIYISYKTSGQYYVKGRLGLVKANISGELAETEDGESYGVAIGMELSNMAFELGYTLVDDDVGFVSVGVVYFPRF